MADFNLDFLFEKVYSSNKKIEALIEEIEYAISCLQKRAADNLALASIFDSTVDDQSIDSTLIEMFYRLRKRLKDQMYVNSRCLDEVTCTFNGKERGYPTGHGAVFVFADSTLKQAGNLESMSKVLSADARDILCELEKGIHIEPALNDLKLPNSMRDYYEAVCELTEIYSKASGNLKRMYEEYAACERMSSSFFKDIGHSNNVEPRKSDITIPTPRIDSVQFTAIAPEKVAAGKYLPMHIVMYEDEYKEIINEIKNNEGEKCKQSKSGYYDVARNAKVKVCLFSPNIDIDDNEEERVWCGKFLDFEFTVLIPDDYSKPQIVFHAAVYVNDVIATKLKLILECAQQSQQDFKIARTDISSAFVSYASKDRNRVVAIIQGMKKARPDMDLFFDVESLHSGQRWEEVLKCEIEKRDILFLCWSKAASESKWVDKEWRYAYEIKGEEYIEPIPIDSPEECPPPYELQQKHFNDMMLFIIKK